MVHKEVQATPLHPIAESFTLHKADPCRTNEAHMLHCGKLGLLTKKKKNPQPFMSKEPSRAHAFCYK